MKNSTKYIALICLCLLARVNGDAQSTILVNKISALSENTNYSLLNTPDHQLCISSLEGLNVFDGLYDYVKLPDTTKMYGKILQGHFFSDRSGLVWFTTYEALHCFDPIQDTMRFVFMKAGNRQDIKDNYSAFKLINDLLYLKAGNELFVYNVSTRQVENQYQISLKDYYQFAVEEIHGSQFLFAGGTKEYSLYELKPKNNFELLDKAKIGIYSCLGQGNTLWAGGLNGVLYKYDLEQHKLIHSYRIGDVSISGIIPFTDSTLLVTNYRNALSIFSIQESQIEESFTLKPVRDCEPIKALVRPYIDSDSTLWIGSDGQGVYYYNLNKRKFKTELEGMDITKLIPYRPDSLLVLTRRAGILLIDKMGNIVKRWSILPDQKVMFSVKTGVMVDRDNLLFTASDHAYVLDLNENMFHKLEVDGYRDAIYFEQVDRLTNGKIVASLDTTFLYEIALNQQTLQLTPYFTSPPGAKMMLNFQQDELANLYVSNDESNVMIFKSDDIAKSHVYDATIPIHGGVLSITDKPGSDEVYLTNRNGIFLLNKKTKVFTGVMDRNSLFRTTVYASQYDTQGKLWLSTNKGLMQYDPVTNKAHAFSKMDGIQELEYNSNVSLVMDDGHMYFGGINGLNYFHPDQVHFSHRPAPVLITEVKINDKTDARYRVPQYVSNLDLSHRQNTISFKFHAIDNADPGAARVKYIMKGVDADTLISEGPEANVRYPGLRPGHYVLSMVGVNSDDVENTESRQLYISIKPPFWMTWWFITLSALAVVGMIYLIVRGYYHRRLERTNQQLREQNLVIEKHQAVEHERTRIASEMHDDLGSGLTTIRYLSDKALRQAKDEDEITQIKTIADKSNDLVRNMSEIIWAMNSRFDNTENLIAYLRRYASEYLDQHQISVEFIIPDPEIETKSIGGEKRRNIFLVFKEILHNTVKYSNAKSVRINMEWNDEFSIYISEIGGTGFDPDLAKEKGNGLYNCQRRMDAIGGKITFERKPEAMEIQIRVPL